MKTICLVFKIKAANTADNKVVPDPRLSRKIKYGTTTRNALNGPTT
jgi:hypothetical protein